MHGREGGRGAGAGGTAVNICGAPWKHGMDRGMGNATGRILSRGADA